MILGVVEERVNVQPDVYLVLLERLENCTQCQVAESGKYLRLPWLSSHPINSIPFNSSLKRSMLDYDDIHFVHQFI